MREGEGGEEGMRERVRGAVCVTPSTEARLGPSGRLLLLLKIAEWVVAGAGAAGQSRESPAMWLFHAICIVQ